MVKDIAADVNMFGQLQAIVPHLLHTPGMVYILGASGRHLTLLHELQSLQDHFTEIYRILV